MKNYYPYFFICFTLNSFAQLPSYVPANGLVGWWPFNGNANDESGNGNDGTVNGATLATDRFGVANKAYSFDGLDDYILTNNQGILGNNPRSVSFWAKTASNSFMSAVAWGGTGSGANMGNGFSCGLNYLSTGATIGGSDCAITYSANNSVIDNQWHHYIFQMALNSQLNQVQIFQDGVLLTNPIQLYNQSTLLNTIIGFNICFGRIFYASGDNLFFNGILDDISIWNRALTICEIKKLYQSGSPVITANTNLSNVCEGSDVNLSSSGSNTYSWTPGNISGDNVTVNVTSSTDFLVTATDLDGCIDTASVYVDVNPLPIVTSTITDSLFCIDESAVSLTGNPSNGTWTGTGVSSGNFNPSVAGTGSHVLNYIFTDGNSCTDSVYQEMIVNSLPTIAISSPISFFCDYNNAVNLTSSPVGGTWVGTGVVGNTFSPPIAGVGNYYITYEYTDANGCSNSDSLFMEVGACLGLNENIFENISIHPNPTHSTFTISGINQNDFSSIEILDITGKLLFKTHSPINIDLSNYENGVYLFRIIGEKNYTGKIVKE